MSQLVVSNAICMCSMGVAPCPLQVLPTSLVNGGNMIAATVTDNIPYVNLSGFGMCNSPANPAVAAATAAKLGVFTPAACMPVFPGPWAPGAIKTKIKNVPALDKSSVLTCAYGGVVSINFPGQVTITVS